MRLVQDGFVHGVCYRPTMCQSRSSVRFVSVRRNFANWWLRWLTESRASEFTDCVHSDVWGPAPIESLGHKCYFVTFIDDATHYTRLYLLQHKNGITPAPGAKCCAVRSSRSYRAIAVANTVREDSSSDLMMTAHCQSATSTICLSTTVSLNG